MINSTHQTKEYLDDVASVNWLGEALAVVLFCVACIWFACCLWLFGLDIKTLLVLGSIGLYGVGWYCYRRHWDVVASHLIVATLMTDGLLTMNAVAASAQTSQLIILSVLLSFILFDWPQQRYSIGLNILLALFCIMLSIASGFDLLGLQVGENQKVFNVFYPLMLLTSLSILSFCLYFFISRHSQLLSKLQAEAMRAEEAATTKSRFLSNMSHEIRTPINGIFGVLQVLRNNSSLSHDQRQLLDAAISSSRQLSAIVDDVLDMAKLESGKMRLEIEPFDIRLLLKDIQTLFSSQLKQKALALKVTIARNVPKQLMGDSLRIAQIFNNVIGNAVKFTLHGEINVKVDYESSILKITVSDTGIGMSPKTLDTLFERFTQADDSIKKHVKGTGLGMAITREFIEMMHGSVVVESVEGQGTTFLIELPLTASMLSFNVGTSNTESPNLGEYKILVVEDNPLNLDVCLTFLRPTGAKLLTAKDGVEAIRLLQRVEVDLLLTDIAMPEMAGDDLLVEARKIYPQLRAVAMTGNVDLSDIDHYYHVGFNEVMSKPLNRDFMLRTMANQLIPSVDPEKSVTSSQK